MINAMKNSKTRERRGKGSGHRGGCSRGDVSGREDLEGQRELCTAQQDWCPR